MHAASVEAFWLRHLLIDIGLPPPGPITLYEDNTSCMALARRDQDNARTKHIDITYHWIRQKLASRTLALERVSSADEIADILTKPVSKHVFIALRDKMGVSLQSGGDVGV